MSTNKLRAIRTAVLPLLGLAGLNMPIYMKNIDRQYDPATSQETLNKIKENKAQDEQNRINKAAEKRARQIRNRAFKKGK